jgi:hypothetical protein
MYNAQPLPACPYPCFSFLDCFWFLSQYPGLVYESTRPRFWYVVLANCKQIDGVLYNLIFSNVNDSFWNREFGVNEQGINTTYAVFTFILLGLVIAHMYGLQVQWTAMNSNFAAELISGFASLPALHRTFTAGLLIFLAATILESLHLALYCINGFGSPMLHLFAFLMRLACQMLIMFLLLLLASGWSVSTENIEHRVRIGSIFSTLGVLYLVLFFWAAARDRASTLYIYDSLPGYTLAAVNAAVGGLFIHWLFESRDQEQDEGKKTFYYRLGVSYAWWFLSTALVIVVASVLDPWVREKTVTSMQLIVDTLAYAGTTPSHTYILTSTSLLTQAPSGCMSSDALCVCVCVRVCVFG